VGGYYIHVSSGQGGGGAIIFMEKELLHFFMSVVDRLEVVVTRCHRGGRMRNINAWYLNTHMVYL
jgi:hypothetical protein